MIKSRPDSRHTSRWCSRYQTHTRCYHWFFKKILIINLILFIWFWSGFLKMCVIWKITKSIFMKNSLPFYIISSLIMILMQSIPENSHGPSPWYFDFEWNCFIDLKYQFQYICGTKALINWGISALFGFRNIYEWSLHA